MAGSTQREAEHVLIRAKTTWPNSDRKMRAVTSQKILNGEVL